VTRNFETVFLCEKCGRPVNVKDPPITRTCQYCRAKETRLLNPNVPVELADELVVTTAVENRLRKRASKEIPRSKSEEVGEVILHLYWLVTFPAAFLIGHLINPDAMAIYGLVGGWILTLLVGITITNMLDKPKKERAGRIKRRVVELAEIRKKMYGEALRFYTSPEWIVLRKRVIQENGPTCARCGIAIKRDVDVTVDHKLPRSKHPEKGLDRSNLQVLCRRCNSKKGAKLLDW
jgi:hypothetical protein